MQTTIPPMTSVEALATIKLLTEPKSPAMLSADVHRKNMRNDAVERIALDQERLVAATEIICELIERMEFYLPSRYLTPQERDLVERARKFLTN